MGGVKALIAFLRAFFVSRTVLAAENLPLRQQLAIVRHSAKRPKLRPRDRVFWVLLSRLWKGWRPSLMIVKPGTVIRRHRQGFKLSWRWRSRASKVGRPRANADVRKLIQRMSRGNPTWGVPRIRAEQARLECTIKKLLDNITKANRRFVDRRLSELSTRRDELALRLEELDAISTSQTELEAVLRHAIGFLSGLEFILSEGVPEEKRDALRRCVRGAEIDLPKNRMGILLRRVPGEDQGDAAAEEIGLAVSPCREDRREAM